MSWNEQGRARHVAIVSEQGPTREYARGEGEQTGAVVRGLWLPEPHDLSVRSDDDVSRTRRRDPGRN
jgi:hypothetical protein